jgi:hypothetical protein
MEEWYQNPIFIGTLCTIVVISCYVTFSVSEITDAAERDKNQKLIDKLFKFKKTWFYRTCRAISIICVYVLFVGILVSIFGNKKDKK